jgi:hypothetical protein
MSWRTTEELNPDIHESASERLFDLMYTAVNLGMLFEEEVCTDSRMGLELFTLPELKEYLARWALDFEEEHANEDMSGIYEEALIGFYDENMDILIAEKRTPNAPLLP